MIQLPPIHVPSSHIPSSSSKASLHSHISHKANRHFSENFIKHGGPKRDGSIYAATRQKELELQQHKKNFEVMDKVLEGFDDELCGIEQLQEKITEQQRFMAQKLLKWYSSVTIQCFYRCSAANYKLKQLKAKRILNNWIFFRFHHIRRLRAYKKIVRFLTMKLFVKKLETYFHIRRCKRIINKYTFRYYLQFKSQKRVALMKNVWEVHKHIMLYGKRKAFSRLMSPYQPNVIVAILKKFINICIYRRRIQLLKSPLYGKLAFYVLSQYCPNDEVVSTVGSSNYIMEYIHQKVLHPFLTVGGSSSDSNTNVLHYRTQRHVTSRQLPILESHQLPSLEAIQSMPNKLHYSDHYSGTSLSKLSHPVDTLSLQDLPMFLKGGFRIKSIYEAYRIIRDMLQIARQHPIYLDHISPPIQWKIPTLLEQWTSNAVVVPIASSRIASTASTAALSLNINFINYNLNIANNINNAMNSPTKGRRGLGRAGLGKGSPMSKNNKNVSVLEAQQKKIVPNTPTGKKVVAPSPRIRQVAPHAATSNAIVSNNQIKMSPMNSKPVTPVKKTPPSEPKIGPVVPPTNVRKASISMSNTPNKVNITNRSRSPSPAIDSYRSNGNSTPSSRQNSANPSDSGALPAIASQAAVHSKARRASEQVSIQQTQPTTQFKPKRPDTLASDHESKENPRLKIISRRASSVVGMMNDTPNKKQAGNSKTNRVLSVNDYEKEVVGKGVEDDEEEDEEDGDNVSSLLDGVAANPTNNNESKLPETPRNTVLDENILQYHNLILHSNNLLPLPVVRSRCESFEVSHQLPQHIPAPIPLTIPEEILVKHHLLPSQHEEVEGMVGAVLLPVIASAVSSLGNLHDEHDENVHGSEENINDVDIDGEESMEGDDIGDSMTLILYDQPSMMSQLTLQDHDITIGAEQGYYDQLLDSMTSLHTHPAPTSLPLHPHISPPSIIPPLETTTTKTTEEDIDDQNALHTEIDLQMQAIEETILAMKSPKASSSQSHKRRAYSPFQSPVSPYATSKPSTASKTVKPKLPIDEYDGKAKFLKHQQQDDGGKRIGTGKKLKGEEEDTSLFFQEESEWDFQDDETIIHPIPIIHIQTYENEPDRQEIRLLSSLEDDQVNEEQNYDHHHHHVNGGIGGGEGGIFLSDLSSMTLHSLPQQSVPFNSSLTGFPSHDDQQDDQMPSFDQTISTMNTTMNTLAYTMSPSNYSHLHHHPHHDHDVTEEGSVLFPFLQSSQSLSQSSPNHDNNSSFDDRLHDNMSLTMISAVSSEGNDDNEDDDSSVELGFDLPDSEMEAILANTPYATTTTNNIAATVNSDANTNTNTNTSMTSAEQEDYTMTFTHVTTTATNPTITTTTSIAMVNDDYYDDEEFESY